LIENLIECLIERLIKRVNEVSKWASKWASNCVMQSFTKVDADHSNDVHLSNDVFFLYVFNSFSSQSFNHIMSEYYINLKYHIKEITNAIHDDEYKFANIAA